MYTLQQCRVVYKRIPYSKYVNPTHSLCIPHTNYTLHSTYSTPCLSCTMNIYSSQCIPLIMLTLHYLYFTQYIPLWMYSLHYIYPTLFMPFTMNAYTKYRLYCACPTLCLPITMYKYPTLCIPFALDTVNCAHIPYTVSTLHCFYPTLFTASPLQYVNPTLCIPYTL